VSTPAFEDIPRRIFLDSSVLQALQTYGGFLYEGEGLDPTDRIHRDPVGPAKLDALRAIMQVAQRAPFEFALSENSFREVTAAHDQSYLQWAYDVLDHWRACAEASVVPSDVDSSALDSSAYGYLGSGDRALIKDALLLGCDSFLTMENRLPRNAEHLNRTLGLRVLSPLHMWELLRPWARLFY
jgi:hypothetical protein